MPRPIDADAVAEEISTLSMTITGLRAGKGVLRELLTEYRKSILRIIDEAPTIEAEPVRHGRWVHCVGKSNLWYCSECGGKILYNPTRRTYNITKLPVEGMNKFCRKCGAKMDAKEDNNAQAD